MALLLMKFEGTSSKVIDMMALILIRNLWELLDTFGTFSMGYDGTSPY